MRTRKFALAAAVMTVAVAGVAQAATYNYVGGAWDVPASWTSSDGGTTYPQVAGDVANLNNSISGGVTLSVPVAGVTLGGMYFQDPDGSHTYNVNGGPLTFQGVSGPASISTAQVGVGTNTFNGQVSMASDLDINIGLQTVTTAGAFAVNSNAVTLSGIATNTKWQINGDLTGDGTVTVNGSAGIDLIGTKSFTGTIVLNGGRSGTSNSGSLTLTTGSMRHAQEIIINGALSGGTTQAGGLLHAGNGSATGTNPGQRIGEHRITLNGGSLAPTGQAAKDAFALENQAESIETLAFNSGYSLLASSKGGSLSNTITIGNLERGTGATGFVQSTTLGTDTKVLVTNFDSTMLKGAGGAAGTATMSIIPWLGANNGGSGTTAPTTFATYIPGVGIRALNTTTEVSSVTGGATVNANNGGGFTLAADTTVNSLRVSHASSNLNGKTLTITSGGLFLTGGQTIGGTAGGTIEFGDAEGVIWVIGSSNGGISATISGTGGLVKAGTGRLVLNNSNTYTGTTIVSGGTLEVGASSNLGDGDVIVANGSLLRILGSDAIADDATVTLQQFGLFNGKLELSGSETIGALYVGNQLVSGTWGATGSGADNINDAFFSGTGMLSVVPEPGVLGAFSVGLMALLRRQRRA